MAGIYIHIPFCRRACHYCDFHFTTNLKNSNSVVDSILKEIYLQKVYLEGESVSTIYFGGGTPTLLPTSDLGRMINQISLAHSVDNGAEITVEANPEDLSIEKLKELREIGVNRLSLGTQSFIDAELQWMNRMHSADQAMDSIRNAQNLGFDNISIDLIFGLPAQTEADWLFNLDKAVSLEIQHISSYGLTIEKKTVLENRIRKGQQIPPDEEMANRFLQMNMEFFPTNGFEHYETSNYAKEGFISQHNSNYWKGEKYLGLGPSAHSFNGISRQWNLRSNAGYTAALDSENAHFEREELSVADRINEHILVGLRTKWGIQKEVLNQIDPEAWGNLIRTVSTIDKEMISVSSKSIILTQKGVHLTDKLTSDLFI